VSVIEVVATGPLCLVQDLGRPGHAAVGVGRSGAADRGALRLANRALGNDEDAAAFEVTLGGLELRVLDAPVWLCVTGAPCPVTVDGRQVGPYAVASARPGSTVRLGAPPSGLRSYVAVRGGLEVAPVLGSRSRDVLAALGPAPVGPGQRFGVGSPAARFPTVDVLPQAPLPAPDEPVVLRAVRGPRDDRVRGVDTLVETDWRVSDRSNRVGARLDGGTLAHVPDLPALPSEGAWRGAVQVPPGGEPVLFLADHPVTGGYPVVAVVVDADVDRAAQARPGQTLRFRWAQAP
jgi:biotin-dependent carboxylase-like uncharacterized protein